MQQDNDRVALAPKIDPIARTMRNSQFAYATAQAFAVTEVAQTNAIETHTDACASLSIA